MKALFKILLILPLLELFSCCNQEAIWWCGTGDYVVGDLKINVSELYYNLSYNNLKLEGEVIDSNTLEPLVGANVVVNTTDLKEVTGTATDIEGKFRLSFKYDPDYLIKFSYIGYKQQTYELKHFLQQYFEDQSGK